MQLSTRLLIADLQMSVAGVGGDIELSLLRRNF